MSTRPTKKKLQHVNRRLTDEECVRHTRIRESAVQDIPPRPGVGRRAAPAGIPAQIRGAREARGLTWYALAKLAGIPNQATIRGIELGNDVKVLEPPSGRRGPGADAGACRAAIMPPRAACRNRVAICHCIAPT